MTTTLEVLRTGPAGAGRGPRPAGTGAHGRHPLGGRRPPLAHIGQPAGGQPRRPRHHRGDVRRVLRAGARRRRRDRGDRRRHRSGRQREAVRHQQHSLRPRRPGDLAGGTALGTAQLSGGAWRHRRHPGARLTQLRRDVGDRAAAAAARRRAAGRRAHRRLPRTGPGAGGRDRGRRARTAGGARSARRLVHRSRRAGPHQLAGHRPQRPGRHAAGRHAAGVPLAGPAAAQRGRHPRRNSGAAERFSGDPRAPTTR